MGRIFPASVFRFPKMRDRCSICGLKFEREEGYFLGAMYISYALALCLILCFAFLLRFLTDWPIVKVVIASVVLFLPFAPVLSLIARVLWIYADQAIDPDRTF